jgi:ribosomal-protein-alanine N-acetyltransferase
MERVIKLRRISRTNIINLALLLSNDNILSQSLSPGKPLCAISAKELFADLEKWQVNNNANTYVIRLGSKSIGSISLSHQNGSFARVGYWLESSEWNKGYATQAFAQIIEIARKRGFETLSASIGTSNIASRRIWEKFGANFTECGDRLTASLSIVT